MYSVEELMKFLSLANKKLKKLKSNIKNVRIERNNYRSKIEKIELLLNNTTYDFDMYDFPAEQEYYILKGKIELKDEILNIINI